MANPTPLRYADRCALAITEIGMEMDRRLLAGLEIPITDDGIVDIVQHWTTSDLDAYDAAYEARLAGMTLAETVDTSDYDSMIDTVFNFLLHGLRQLDE